jgi:ABC-type multidrug transport system ATPase subunit
VIATLWERVSHPDDLRVIEIQGLTKTFGHGPNAVTVLDDIDFAVAAGEIFAVVGPSGAG